MELKGLILSGGKGTRLRPITHTSAKQLVPVANKPVLFYGVEAMAAAGISDVGIIIAPETGGEIREAAVTGRGSGSRSPTSSRTRRSGSRTPCWTAEPFLADSAFVMYLGDNLLQGGIPLHPAPHVHRRRSGSARDRQHPAHPQALSQKLGQERLRPAAAPVM